MPPSWSIVVLGGSTVRALRECPHLRIEIWGTPSFSFNLEVATRPNRQASFAESNFFNIGRVRRSFLLTLCIALLKRSTLGAARTPVYSP
jgi:hypothetical protein